MQRTSKQPRRMVASGEQRRPGLLVLPEALCEAASGYDLKRIAASLDDAGAIVDRDTDGKRRYTKRVSVNGEKHRVYAIGQNALLFAIDE